MAQIAKPDSLQKLKDPAAHAAKQNAISAKGSKMAIEKSNQLAIATMIERSRAVTANNAQFFKDVAASKVLPFEKLQKRYVEEFPRKLDSLSAQYAEILEEKDPAEIRKMASSLQDALAPLGAYLQAAPHKIANMSMDAEQFAEMNRLRELDPRTQIGSEEMPMLKAQSPHHTYTLMHVPVSLQVRAVPESKVYFRSGGGGQFSNGLTLQEVTADKQGVATTTWVSEGDATGVAIISVANPQSSNPVHFKINVVELKLKLLPKLPELLTQRQLPKQLNPVVPSQPKKLPVLPEQSR